MPRPMPLDATTKDTAAPSELCDFDSNPVAPRRLPDGVSEASSEGSTPAKDSGRSRSQSSSDAWTRDVLFFVISLEYIADLGAILILLRGQFMTPK